MLKKITFIFSKIMLALTLLSVSVHAASVSTTGDGYSVNFSITASTVSGSVTGKYSSGASVTVNARYKNVSGQLSKHIYRSGSPYTSIALSEMERLNGQEKKSWTGGKAIGYPTSLNKGVSTTWLEL